MSDTIPPDFERNVTDVEKGALAWLREFMKEINSQDNRATATPYYYELRYVDEEDDSAEKRVDYGQSCFFTEKAAKAYIEANQHNLPEGTYTYLCWAGRNHEMLLLLTAIGKVTGVGYERK